MDPLTLVLACPLNYAPRLGGVLFFDREPDAKSLFGACVALLSITFYAGSKLPRPERKAAAYGKLPLEAGPRPIGRFASRMAWNGMEMGVSASISQAIASPQP